MTEAGTHALGIVVVRPEPGCTATVEAARTLGMAAVGFPLFDVAPVPWQLPPATGYHGLLAGSANVFRHGGAGLRTLAGLPVHAVGEATAVAAREAGFDVAGVGMGGLQHIGRDLPPGRYLRLAGEQHVTLEPSHGAAVDTVVVYAAPALPVPPALATRLAAGTVVLLHSGEAARHFAGECDRLGIDRGRIALACLAPRIAQVAGSGWESVGVAAERTDPALLALAKEICQRV